MENFMESAFLFTHFHLHPDHTFNLGLSSLLST